MKRFPPVIALVTLAVLRSGPADAGPNANAKIVLHLAAPTAKNACTRPETTPPCDGVVTAGDLHPASYFAYVLAMDGSAPAGLGGLQFGIDYNGTLATGVDVFTWTSCAFLEFPQPLPGIDLYRVDIERHAGILLVDLRKRHDRRTNNRIIRERYGRFSGSFRLAVDISSGGDTGRCTSDVTVADATCSVFGPDSVLELTRAEFSAPPVPGVAYRWSVHGNGFLAGPASGSTVQILPSFLGWMTVTLNRSTGAGSDSCSRTVRVNRNTEVSFNGGAELLVHLASPAEQNPCERSEARPTCENAVVTGGLAPIRYFAYILLTHGFGDGGELGIGELNAGIRYDVLGGQGVDIFSWSPCDVTESPDSGWPQSGTGNHFVWNDCQRFEPGGAGSGISATPGYFYLAAYSPDLLIFEKGSSVVDCTGVINEIQYLGATVFGDTGYPPCDHPQPLPVMNTTWGAIKSLYAR